MVFYRKYRPQSLSDLLGQPVAKTMLTSVISNGKVAQAYLFCGPKGTGKTSTARILAKAVNCEARNDKDNSSIPCNICATCISITDGSNLDLIEIDAASNRGIDDIRALRETIKLSPTGAKKKVYIIDEAHMLTTEAFNALLKTLEEPPEHVLFVLATTDPQKIPATILSRVQRVDFQPASVPELMVALKKIVEAEKIDIDEESLLMIANKSEGSFRDGEKLLDQLSSTGEKITPQMVEESFKSGSAESLLQILQFIATKNGNQSLTLISQEMERGTNPKEFILSLLEITRTMLFIKHNSSKVMNGLNEESLKKLHQLSDQFNLSQIIHLIDSLHLALERMKTSTIPSLPLEVAVLENCQIEQKTAALPVSSDVKSEPVKEQVVAVSEIKEETTHSGVDDMIVHSDPDLNKLLDKWQFILETIKPYNYSLEAMLKQVKITSCDGGIVILEVPYSFHQRIIEAPKSRTLLESVMADIIGKEAKVRCVLGSRPLKIEEISNIELAEDDEVLRVAAEIFNSDSIS